MAEIIITSGEYNFPDVKKGNVFKERQISFTDADGNPPVDNLVDVIIRFRFGKAGGNLQKEIKAGAGLVIIDAANWVAKITKFKVDFPIGSYYYDIDALNDLGDIETPIEGKMNVKFNR